MIKDIATELYAKGFPVIPVAGKRAKGEGWQTRINDARLEPNGNFNSKDITGVGIVTGHKVDDGYLAAIDVDITNKELSRKLCSMIAGMVGDTIAFRVGKAPKFLVPVVIDQLIPKMRSAAFTDGTTEQRIEVLCKGAQFVAKGKHPDGKNYAWYNDDDNSMSIDTLPRLTVDQIDQIIEWFEDNATKFDLTQVSSIKPKATTDDPFKGVLKSDTSTDEIRELLKHIDADAPYDDWYRVGTALFFQYEGSEEGFELFNEWSSQGAKYDGEERLRFKWESFENYSGDRAGIPTIAILAKQGGANLSAIAKEFKGNNTPDFTFEQPVELGEPTPPTPPAQFEIFKPMTDEYLSDRHIVRWSIKHILERGIVAALFGASGLGKSFVTISMACSIATGKEWLGHKTKPGKVLYIAGEGFHGVKRRVYGWRMEHDMIDTDNLIVTSRVINFGSKEDLALLKSYLDTQEISLIIIDTLARATAGMDENSVQDMSPFMEHLGQLTRQYGCSTLVVHHTGKSSSQEARGSSAIKGAMDAEFRLEQTQSGIMLCCNKMKDGDEFDPIRMKLISQTLPENFADEDGDLMTTATLHPDDTEEVGYEKATLKEQFVIKAYNELFHDKTNRLPSPVEFMQNWGMDAPAEGVDVEQVRERFYRMHPDDTKQDTMKKSFQRALAGIQLKDIGALLDNLLVIF